MNTKPAPFLDAIGQDVFLNAPGKLPFILGYDDADNLAIEDLANFQHMIIAGFSGTGKSVLAHSIILSMALHTDPNKVRFLLADTKLVEFAGYKNLPHLLAPVYAEREKIVGELLWVYNESLRRLRLFADNNVTNLDEYNDYAWEHYTEELPRIVVVVDDAAVVLTEDGITDTVQQLAQNGRAVGIHLVLITQNPGSKKLLEIVRSQIPARVVCASLNATEEKQLLGRKSKGPIRSTGQISVYDFFSHACRQLDTFHITSFTLQQTMERILDKYTADQALQKVEPETAAPKKQTEIEPTPEEPESDEMFSESVDVILETGQASVSMLQRRLKLGYARAARIVDEMEEKGIVGPFQGSKPRAILITKEAWETRKAMESGQTDSTKDRATAEPTEPTESTESVEPTKLAEPTELPVEPPSPEPCIADEPTPNQNLPETVQPASTGTWPRILRTMKSGCMAALNGLCWVIYWIFTIPIALANDPTVDKPSKTKTAAMWIGAVLIVVGIFDNAELKSMLLISGIAIVLIAGVTALRWIALALLNARMAYVFAVYESGSPIVVGIFAVVAIVFAGKAIQRIRKNLLLDKGSNSMAAVDKMTGTEFENFAARVLRRADFSNISVTKASGDQGIDVLAEKNGLKYAIQCKHYAKKVDNSSVQEAFTGRTFYGCDVAVVLTNSYFTESAKTLAAATGVKLWDRDWLIAQLGKQ